MTPLGMSSGTIVSQSLLPCPSPLAPRGPAAQRVKGTDALRRPRGLTVGLVRPMNGLAGPGTQLGPRVAFVHVGSTLCDYWVRICVNERRTT